MPDAPPTDGTSSPVDASPTARRRWPVRALAALGRFFWDFLVGDTPELFVGAVVVLTAVAVVAATHAANTVAVVAFPVLVALLLTWSVRRAWRKH